MIHSKLSVVLAVYNEEAVLERCLNSAKEIADEIVLVDGHSSDRTVSIAKEFKAKVIQTTNKSNFHINKQMAINAASHPLILQLDADELIDAELLNWLKKLKTSPKASPFDAWYIRRKNFFMNRWLSKGGQYPDSVIRLLRIGKARLPMLDVHEQMVVDGETGEAGGHLIHYGNPSLTIYFRKHNTYTTFTANSWYAENTKITFIFVVKQMFFSPTKTFLSIYFRHRGYVDGLPGFVFALLSALHFPVALIKLWELYENRT